MAQRSSKSSTGGGSTARRTKHSQKKPPTQREASADARRTEEHWPGIEDVDPEQSVRERRHPGALADPLETDISDTVHPVEREAHPRAQRHHSGTLADAGEDGGLRVHEPGVTLEPEELGVQFLRDATEQDNFESSRRSVEEHGEPAIEPVVSEASLESADQQDVDWPTSSAFENEQGDEAPPEGAWSELDVRSDVLREVSLLDQGVDADASRDDVEEALQPPGGRTQTRSPTLQTDDVSVPDEASSPREDEKRRLLRQLRKLRPRPHETPPQSTR